MSQKSVDEIVSTWTAEPREEVIERLRTELKRTPKYKFLKRKQLKRSIRFWREL